MDAPWMEELEQRVRQVTDELTRLRKENRRLQKVVRAEGGSGEAREWQRESDEVRERVERLAARLAGLLGEDL